ncbi:MAG TPA: alpha/beta hydrolase [Rubrobacteraceae bacterium]|jgi:pimeloyl-ACP methyl ester carboxylesterase|nr:alpha/beta hydrolase [Rubrobacteraceae bacterium]
MPFADSQGMRIYYDDRGSGDTALLCLPGWCVHHTIFSPLAERLDVDNRVLAMDWRGHGDSQASDGDFGYPEMVADAVAVIEASGAESVITIAHAHGGWVAVELCRQLAGRVPRMIFISWNPFITGRNPLAPPSLREVPALQSPALWQALQDEARRHLAVNLLVTAWVGDAPASVAKQIWDETGTHGYEMWSRAGREITAMFTREGDPLQALSTFRPPVPVLHVYAQPPAPEYLSAQESVAWDHPWFAVRRIEAVSQFPMLEVPDETAEVIREYIQ